MTEAKQPAQAEIFYSLCSGYNFYQRISHQQYSIFGKNKSVIQHVKTGDLFYITELPAAALKRFALSFWIALIRKPVDLKHFIWPVDIIAWQEAGKASTYALVFPLRAMPVYQKLTDVLSNDQRLGWRQAWVKTLVADFLDAWSSFDLSGYAYHEFSEQNMFYQNDTFHVMFDFSFSTHKVNTIYTSQYVSPDRITPEYADSLYYAAERQNVMDRASDYYSIAVILFKLLIGRLPYQGTVMEHEPDSTPKEHENWLQIYHRNPYFIFDERDETNRIGGDSGFAKDEIYVERWNELPQHIRNMFHNVFQTANVLRTANKLLFYSPAEWRAALFGAPIEVPLVYREAEQRDNSAASKIDSPPSVQPARDEYSSKAVARKSDPPMPAEPSEPAQASFAKEADIQYDDSQYYNVIITKVPSSSRVVALKVIRDITGASLAAVKRYIEQLPSTIAEGVSLALAKKVQAELKSAHVESKLRATDEFNAQLEAELNERLA